MAAMATFASGASSALAEPTAHRELRLDVLAEAALGGCVEPKELAQAVAERLGYDPFRDGAKETARVRVKRTGARVIAEVELQAANGKSLGTRMLESHGDCPELRESVASAIALGIDPLADGSRAKSAEPVASVRQPPSSTPEPALPVQLPVPEPSPASMSAREPRHALEARIGLGIGAAFFALPSVAPSAELYLGLKSGAWRVGLSSGGLFPQSVAGSPSYDLTLGALTAEALFGGSTFALGPILRGGVVAGSVPRDGDTVRASAGFVDIGARGALELPLWSRLFFRAQIDLAAAPLRTSVRLAGREDWIMPIATFDATVLFLGAL